MTDPVAPFPRRRRSRAALPFAIALAGLTACGGEAPPPVEAPAVEEYRGPVATGPGFDPATLAVGTAVGPLVADSVAVEAAQDGRGSVGLVRFRGDLEVTGHPVRHPDTPTSEPPACFEADSAGAALLPAWTGDRRRPWFCFENPEAAGRMLLAAGARSDTSAVRVVVDRYTIVRAFTDVVNTARLLRVDVGLP